MGVYSRMARLLLALDVQDQARVKSITTVPYEKPMGQGEEVMRDKNHVSRGELLRRLFYHLDLFQKDLLPELELPPVVSACKLLCVNLSHEERELWRGLAARCGWTMTGLARALIFYHWTVREEYFASLPGLSHIDRMGKIFQTLSFQPDRLNPWYYHATEARAAIDAKAKADQSHIVELLRAGGVAEEVIETVVDDLENAAARRAEYEWEHPYISPEALRHNEHKRDGGM